MTVSNVMAITKCHLCPSTELPLILNFGFTPLANGLVKESHVGLPDGVYPLQLVQCAGCGCVQLKHNVDSEVLFRNYLYASNKSPTLVKHFEDYASHVSTKLNLNKSARIIGIGGNTGDLELAFKALGFSDILNIEPATNIAQISQSRGIETLNKFFGTQTAMELGGNADLITSNNVFAHLTDYNGFVMGIKWILANKGTWVFEVNYWADLVKNKCFDVIYHEHTVQWLVGPLKKFLATFELEIYDIERIANQGGSIRVYVQHLDGGKEIKSIVDDLIKKETEAGLYKDETYTQFHLDLLKKKESLLALLNEYKEQGATIACAGVAAKFCTFSHFMGIDKTLIDFAMDDSELKQGLFTPGNHIPIYSFHELYKRKPDFVLISSWNYADSIMSKHRKYTSEGGKFIIPFPDLYIYPS